MRFALTVCLALSVAAPCFANDWVDHIFGDQRRYLKDWMAVCDDGGAGACRIVQLPPADDDICNDQRLALHAVNGGWEISVFDRDMPAADIRSLAFRIDDRIEINVFPRILRQGELAVGNIADTVTVDDPVALAALIAAMRVGTTLSVTYDPAGFGDGSAIFSLRGMVAAMLAVDEKLGRLPSN